MAKVQSDQQDFISQAREYMVWLLKQQEVARFIYMVVIVGTGYYLVQLVVDGDFSYGAALGIVFAWFLLIIILEPPKAGSIEEDAFDNAYIDQMIS
jgi:hypothetical protein